MIQESKITCFDGLIEQNLLIDLTKLFHNLDWKFGWHSNTIGESLLHWNKHFAGGGKSSKNPCDEELANNKNFELVYQVWQKFKETILPGHSLIRCYANAHTFGLDGTIHRDNPIDMEMTTTIIYCHHIWPLAWGGEILFYSEDCENILSAVFPKPGRVVSFPGSILHSAKSPTRICREIRISLVFKSIKAGNI